MNYEKYSRKPGAPLFVVVTHVEHKDDLSSPDAKRTFEVACVFPTFSNEEEAKAMCAKFNKFVKEQQI